MIKKVVFFLTNCHNKNLLFPVLKTNKNFIHSFEQILPQFLSVNNSKFSLKFICNKISYSINNNLNNKMVVYFFIIIFMHKNSFL